MPRIIQELFTVLETVEHADLDADDIKPAKTFPSLVAALTNRIFEKCASLLPEFVLGRVLVGTGSDSLDYFRESPFIPPPGKELDRNAVAALLAYIRFSGVLAATERGGGITRRLIAAARSPKRLVMLGDRDKKSWSSVNKICLEDDPLSIEPEFRAAVERLKCVVNNAPTEDLPLLDHDEQVDSAFGNPTVTLPDSPDDLSYHLVRLWLNVAELSCYWVCGNPFTQPYPWGGIYFLAKAPPDEHQIIVTGLLSREIFIRAHLIEQLRAWSLEEKARIAAEHEAHGLRQYQSVEPLVLSLLQALSTAEQAAHRLRGVLDLPPAQLVIRYGRPAFLIPGDEDGSRYYARWTFRHRWIEGGREWDWDAFRAQVSCILLAFAGNSLPGSSTDEWTGDDPHERLKPSDYQWIGDLVGFTVAKLKTDAIQEDCNGASLFFQFLKQCFHSPHKAGNNARLTGALIALWAVEKHAASEDARSVVEATLWGHLSVSPAVLASLEAIRQMVVEKSHDGKLSVSWNEASQQVEVKLSGAHNETVNAVKDLAQTASTQAVGGREGAIRRLVDERVPIITRDHDISVRLRFVEKD